MSVLNNKKKAPGQITCNRDITSSLSDFSEFNGHNFEWLQKHLKHFTENRSSAMYMKGKGEYRLVEPIAGATLTIINRLSIMDRYKGRIDTANHEVCINKWREQDIINAGRPEFSGNFTAITEKTFYKITLVSIYRRWLTAVIEDAVEHGFKVYYGIGHAYMALLDGPDGVQIGLAI